MPGGYGLNLAFFMLCAVPATAPGHRKYLKNHGNLLCGGAGDLGMVRAGTSNVGSTLSNRLEKSPPTVRHRRDHKAAIRSRPPACHAALARAALLSAPA
jgi:hypothetical protein